MKVGFSPFGQCSDALGPTSAQVRAGWPGDTAKPLTGIHQETHDPLVSGIGSQTFSGYGSGRR
jgi:hypothetical protein